MLFIINFTNYNGIVLTLLFKSLIKMNNELFDQLDRCLNLRLPILDQEHSSAVRLYNGFYEGIPNLVIDILGRTLMVNWHGENPNDLEILVKPIQEFYLEKLPWIETILLKARQLNEELKTGKMIFGKNLQHEIKEHGILYALDLQLNQDNSFYLDTRNMRLWLLNHMNSKSVLNTFAYTGSLGIAALAGGASRVVQTDLNAHFLALSKRCASLNRFSRSGMDIMPMDFFKMVRRFKTSQTLFDCVILDPPFFSTTEAGRVDLVNEYGNLINKVRPLVGHEGWLILINNALYVSGVDMMTQINALCEGPYLSFQEIIPVPEDVCGYKETIVNTPPTNPAPFNHPTKIAILKVFRKDKRII